MYLFFYVFNAYRLLISRIFSLLRRVRSQAGWRLFRWGVGGGRIGGYGSRISIGLSRLSRLPFLIVLCPLVDRT